MSHLELNPNFEKSLFWWVFFAGFYFESILGVLSKLITPPGIQVLEIQPRSSQPIPRLHGFYQKTFVCVFVLWVLASQCSSMCSHQRWSRRSFIIGAIPRRHLPHTPDHTSPGSINQRRLLLTHPLIFSTLGLLRQASQFFKEEKYGKSSWQISDSMQRTRASSNV